MTARIPLLRPSAPPMRMTFDTPTRTITRYEGRVPPRWNGCAFDARVDEETMVSYR